MRINGVIEHLRIVHIEMLTLQYITNESLMINCTLLLTFVLFRIVTNALKSPVSTVLSHFQL